MFSPNYDIMRTRRRGERRFLSGDGGAAFCRALCQETDHRRCAGERRTRCRTHSPFGRGFLLATRSGPRWKTWTPARRWAPVMRFCLWPAGFCRVVAIGMRHYYDLSRCIPVPGSPERKHLVALGDGTRLDSLCHWENIYWGDGRIGLDFPRLPQPKPAGRPKGS